MADDLRILLVIDNLGSGGAQRQMVNLALGLQARGHKVAFFLYTPGDAFLAEVQERNIPVYRHLKRSRYSFDVIVKLCQHLRTRRYDVVLAYMPTPNFYAILGGLLTKGAPPVVISERFYDPPEGLPRQEVFARQFYRFAAHLVVNSRHQSANLRRKYPELANRITTIYNGLDLEKFSPPDREPLEPPPLRLLGLSHVSPYKNILCLVRALGILAKEYHLRPCVSWAGRHFDSRHSVYLRYLQQINHEIDELGIAAQWRWLYEQTDIIGLLHDHHALVHPSFGEGLPNAVCEAMACGRPVILSNVLEHPSLIDHGVSGFLFDETDPHDLAWSIAALNDLSTNERLEMGRKARTFAEEHFSLPRLVEQYETLFSTLEAVMHSRAHEPSK